MAMGYLIWTQRNRDVNQILYDFNTETLNDTLSKLKYRRNEVKMRKIMKAIWWILVIVMNFYVGYESFADYYLNHVHITIGYLSVIFLVQTSFFGFLMFVMKKSHKFEYDRVRNHMIIY